VNKHNKGSIKKGRDEGRHERNNDTEKKYVKNKQINELEKEK